MLGFCSRIDKNMFENNMFVCKSPRNLFPCVKLLTACSKCVAAHTYDFYRKDRFDKRRGKTRDKKILSCFAMVHDFYPTRCVFSIPKLALLGDGKRTRCVKIIYNPKLLKLINIFEILLIRDDASNGS